jgi:hypothetical protein
MSGVASSLRVHARNKRKVTHNERDNAKPNRSKPVAQRNYALGVCLVHAPHVDELSDLLDPLLQLHCGRKPFLSYASI